MRLRSRDVIGKHWTLSGRADDWRDSMVWPVPFRWPARGIDRHGG